MGRSDMISPSNETKWRKILTSICNSVVDEGTAGLQRTLCSRLGGQDRSWSGWMKDNIACLWSEQIVVARAVLQSLEVGVEF